MVSTPSRRTVAVLLVALLAVLAGCSGGGGQQAAQSGGDGGRSVEGGGGGGGGGVGSYYTDDGDRVIVRESNMRLEVGNFSRSFRRLRRIAARHGGYVGDRSQDSEGEYDTGRITVRVPAENFSAARDDVAGLGTLENENVEVLDFTAEYENREQRIEQLRADERRLEGLLNRTNDTDRAAELYDQLQEIREQIRELQQQQQTLRSRQTMSTIRVSMHEPESRKPPKNYDTAFGFGDAFLEAFYGGLEAVKWVIVFFGYAIPVGIALVPLGGLVAGLILVWRRTYAELSGLLDRKTGPGDRGGSGGDGRRSTPDDGTGEESGSGGDSDGSNSDGGTSDQGSDDNDRGDGGDSGGDKSSDGDEDGESGRSSDSDGNDEGDERDRNNESGD
ncbi:DUF4349 domain-containing protein [Halobacteriales archaeon QS_1_68_17]|nr:MAG: DUF4349 domain-containing protein [Halobacteriales archaeon QS_1_68_17]